MGSISKIPEGTHTVAIGFGDLNGIMRGKRIPSHNWENICKNGTAICLSALVYDMTCDVWDTPVANNDNGYPDMHIFPQTQPVPLPWEPGVAISFANIIGMDHKPVSVDSRRVLERQVNRAKQLGYEIMVGTELEFFLLDPATKKPKDEGIQVYFGDWMLLATPMSAIMLLCGWFLLTHIVFPVNIKGSPETSNALNDMYKELGDMRSDERRVLIIFAFTAFAWMFSKLLVQLPFLTGLTDYGIAIFAALAIFITRSSSGEGLIDWKTTKNLPWGILLLFGGGLSMAGAIKSSMLGDWIGSFFSSDISAILLIFIIVTLIVFLTELTSNQATTATFVPIMIAIAGSDIGLVSQLAIPVALAASCAFMLPVATPPNAIVYGSEKFTIAQMMKAGFYLNVIGILVVTLFSAYVLPLIF